MYKLFTQTLVTLLLLLSAALPGARGDEAERLNLLIITADDMNGDSPGYMGNPLKLTPNLDAFAATAMQFRSAHVTVPICQPCRSAFMTGLVPHKNGALGFMPIKVGVPTMVSVLQKAGYWAGVVEKHVHMQPYSEFSWDVKLSGGGKNPPLMREQMDKLFAAAKESGKPFFINANITDPHRPFPGSEQGKQKAAGKSKKKGKGTVQGAKSKARLEAADEPDADDGTVKANPAGKVAERRKAANDAGAANDAEGEDEGDPRSVAEPRRTVTPDEVKVLPFLPDLPDIDKETAQYYTAIGRLDDTFKSIMDALKASGHEDDTIVVFFSDHGISMPFSKASIYYNGTWSPELVRYPGMGEPRKFEKEFINSLDLMPSLLEIMKVQAPSDLDGKSWVPLVKGETQEGRDHVITHVNSTSSQTQYPQRCIRTHDTALMFHGWTNGKEKFKVEAMNGLAYNAMEAARASDPAIEARVVQWRVGTPIAFYDLKNDPYEKDNIAGETTQKPEIERLGKLLLAHMKKTNDPQTEAFTKAMKEAGFELR